MQFVNISGHNIHENEKFYLQSDSFNSLSDLIETIHDVIFTIVMLLSPHTVAKAAEAIVIVIAVRTIGASARIINMYPSPALIEHLGGPAT